MSLTTQLQLKIIPNSSRSMIVGWMDHLLKIKVTAQPEKGKANKEVVTLVAKCLGLPKKDVSIVAGKTSQLKTIQINNMKHDEVIAKLNSLTST